MSISSGGASGVDQLLALLSDPEKYRAQLADLQAAAKVAEDQIALAAPASEIVQLREQLKKAKAEQDRIDADTNKRVAQAMAKAQEDANEILEKAQEEAAQLQAQAGDALSKAQGVKAEAEMLRAAADTRHQDADRRHATLTELDQSLTAREQAVLDGQAGNAKERKRLADIAKKLSADLG